jgi:ribulose kinase
MACSTHLGGVMSPEMQTPKLMWVKRNMPGSWQAAGHFFDLADFLTFRATGNRDRSQCTLACKWTYLAHESPAGSAISSMPSASTMLMQRRPARDGRPRRQPISARSCRMRPRELGLSMHCRVGPG